MAKKKHHSKAHYSTSQVLRLCHGVAREIRMADESAFTAMHVISLYQLLITEGFKQQRLNTVAKYINDLEQKVYDGEVNLDDLQAKIKSKSEDINMEYVEYHVEDIKSKNKLDYLIDLKQLDPQNRMNYIAYRRFILLYSALIDLYGYGGKRLERVQDGLIETLKKYQVDKSSVAEMRIALLDAGIWIENPLDPLTNKRVGSMMVGY